mmetsp:Transcript_14617/g.22041  ORF Transcript_14617/g.22041 Transcript_14617/m.22041 type:complete len:677 (-) Transcript_14617:115-2145(-)
MMEVTSWDEHDGKHDDRRPLASTPDHDDDDIEKKRNYSQLTRKEGIVNKLTDIYIRHPLEVFCGSFLLLILPLVIALIIVSLSKPHNGDSYSCMMNEDNWASTAAVESVDGGGLVAADDYRCSVIGADVLRDGGNAMDAAVATALCLGVVSPASSGLGGGCFILGYNATSASPLFIDAREIAPLSATEDMYVDDPTLSLNGGLAVAIPGELKGLYLAWQLQGGGVTWNRVVSPSVDLAEKWEISSTVARYINFVHEELESNPELYADLISLLYKTTDQGFVMKTAGDFIENPALADTLRGIASEGPSYLHDTMADNLAAEINAAGGNITGDEIRSYESTVRDAIQMNLMGHEFYGAPPPSSGGSIVGAILKFLDGYTEPIVSQGGLYYHHLAEAMKHSFAIRMALGDPDFVNVTGVISDILDGDLIPNLRSITREDSVLDDVSDYGGSNYGVPANLPNDYGTSHISVVDREGHAVAITSTVNTYFGSKIFSPSTGIVFNNEMDDFSSPNSSNYFGLAPSETNFIKPGKKPLSSMSPTIMVRNSDKRVRLVGGASGGSRIITATAQVLLNYLCRGMSLLDAVIHPRIHSQLLPEYVYLEDMTLDCDYCKSQSDGTAVTLESYSDQQLVDALTSRGHNITIPTGSNFGVCQFIDVEYELLKATAVSDPRKGGIPAAEK